MRQYLRYLLERALHPAGQVLTAKQAPLITRLLLDLEDAEGVRSWVDDPGGPGGCSGCWPGSAALVLQLSPAFPAESPDDLRRADGRSANGWPVTTCRVLVTSQADSFWPPGRQSSQDIVNAASTGPAAFSCHERWARHGRSGPWLHITSHSRCAC